MSHYYFIILIQWVCKLLTIFFPHIFPVVWSLHIVHWSVHLLPLWHEIVPPLLNQTSWRKYTASLSTYCRSDSANLSTIQWYYSIIAYSSVTVWMWSMFTSPQGSVTSLRRPLEMCERQSVMVTTAAGECKCIRSSCKPFIISRNIVWLSPPYINERDHWPPEQFVMCHTTGGWYSRAFC